MEMRSSLRSPEKNWPTVVVQGFLLQLGIRRRKREGKEKCRRRVYERSKRCVCLLLQHQDSEVKEITVPVTLQK